MAVSGPAFAQQSKLPPDMHPTPIGDLAQWFGPDNYPAEAVRAARQGRTLAALGIDERGEVVSCSIVQSSGTSSLDIATCTIALANLHFNPATDHNGNPIYSVYQLPIRWQLPEAPPATAVELASAGKDQVTEIEAVYGPDGSMLSCKLLSAAPGANPCGGFKPGMPTPRRWLMNGTPVGVTVLERYSEHVIPTP